MAKEGSIFLNLLNLSPKKISDIISVLGDLQEIFKASKSKLAAAASLDEQDISMILTARKSGALDKELKLIGREKVSVIDIFDDQYPALLKEIFYPPLVLYIKGDIDTLKKNLFAIVGTRKPTSYGMSVAAKFSYKLASSGLCIVSGLAKGIDTIAHKQAIAAGQSIAVLGSGLRNIYPRENQKLSEKIAGRGAVISEFPLDTAPLRENFPRRNRIVSGLSLGVLLVEAAVRSGALITARLACEQNREVFAVPGSVNSALSKGTHLFIKEGAKLADSADDILNDLKIYE